MYNAYRRELVKIAHRRKQYLARMEIKVDPPLPITDWSLEKRIYVSDETPHSYIKKHGVYIDGHAFNTHQRVPKSSEQLFHLRGTTIRAAYRMHSPEGRPELVNMVSLAYRIFSDVPDAAWDLREDLLKRYPGIKKA